MHTIEKTERVTEDIEIHFTRPSRVFLKGIQHLFPKEDIFKMRLCICVINLKVDVLGPFQKKKRDQCLDFVMALNRQVKDQLGDYFFDVIDPTSGHPLYTESNAMYPECEGCSRILGMEVNMAGCCKLARHPEWDVNIYPFTMFTDAPLDRLETAILPLIPQLWSPEK